MSDIKTVAVAGASGSLGLPVLKALVDAGFSVTVLTRSQKPGAYDSNVKVIEVDFTSVESLTAALQGIDGLVSTVGFAGMESQTILIDAAIAAGVKRFIPSEYGSVTTNPKLEGFPIYAGMWKTKRYMQEQGRAGKLTWTVLACGAFLNYLFDTPLLLDITNHKATLFDEGDNRISATSLLSIGKAIVGILRNFEATKNRIVRVSEVIITQNKLLKIAEELSPDVKWEVSKVPTSNVLQEGLDALKAGDSSPAAVIKVVAGTAFAGEVYGSAYDETDNELLGVKDLSEEDLKKIVENKLADRSGEFSLVH